MVKADTVDGHKLAEVVLVRSIVTVPRNNVKRAVILKNKRQILSEMC
jgi:hypothetical protein